MRTVLADTGYWIAILNPREQLHQKARSITNSLIPLKIVTSEMIFTELLNAFSKQGIMLRQTTVRLIDRAFNNPNIEVVSQTSELFRNALNLYPSFITLGRRIIKVVPKIEQISQTINLIHSGNKH